jgi:hypothetical protein
MSALGHKRTDMTASHGDVRYSPKSRHGGQQCELPLGIDLNGQCELRSLIPHISHALINPPNLQVRVMAWLEHRQ